MGTIRLLGLMRLMLIAALLLAVTAAYAEDKTNDMGAWGRGKRTETAGTVINTLVPGTPGAYTYLTFARYTAQGTAHTLTMLRGQTHAECATAAAAAATAITVDRDMQDGAGNALAANDYVAIKLDNGDWHLGLVDTSGWTDANNTITLTSGTAIPTGRSVAVGAPVVSFGVAGDANHAAYTLTGTASATSNYPAVANAGPLAKSPQRNSPILLQSNNATAAGTIEGVSATFGSR